MLEGWEVHSYAMNMENQPLVSDEQVENHISFGIYLNVLKWKLNNHNNM